MGGSLSHKSFSGKFGDIRAKHPFHTEKIDCSCSYTGAFVIECDASDLRDLSQGGHVCVAYVSVALGVSVTVLRLTGKQG